MRWDSEIKDIGQVVDKRARCRHHDILRLCPWIIHNDPMTRLCGGRPQLRQSDDAVVETDALFACSL